MRGMGQSTHTVAGLEVSATTYDEIAAKLREADYGHAFSADGMIDMGGIGLVREAAVGVTVVGASNLPQWKCHKVVGAAKIVHMAPERPRQGDHALLTLELTATYPSDDPLASRSMSVNPAWIEKHNPVLGGYYVEYEDGYSSFSPAEAFEKGYARL